jgi:hypothetical protein
MNKMNTQEAVAIAIHAFRTNKNKVVKFEEKTDNTVYLPNKQYLLEHLTAPSVVITDDLRAEADRIIQKLGQAITLGELTNRPVSDFAKTVNKTIVKETLQPKDFGIAVWLPKVVADIDARELVQENTYQYISTSKHVGKPKEKMALEITVIERRWIKNFDRWAVVGNDQNGNLISFLTHHDSLTQGQLSIVGKVKNHIRDTYRANAHVTQFNYVKKAV